MSSTPARTHKPHWQRRPERRPDEILDAAPRVFTRCGLHKTNLEEAAKEAGISKGTIYLYFKDKEKLFVAAAQRVAPNPDEIYGGQNTVPPQILWLGCWILTRPRPRCWGTTLLLSPGQSAPLRFATLLLHQDGRGLAPSSSRTCPAHVRHPQSAPDYAESGARRHPDDPKAVRLQSTLQP